MWTRTATRVLATLLGGIAPALPAAAEVTVTPIGVTSVRTLAESFSSGDFDEDVAVVDDVADSEVTVTSQLGPTPPPPALPAVTSTSTLRTRVTITGESSAAVEVSGSFHIRQGEGEHGGRALIFAGFSVCATEPTSFTASASGETEGTQERFNQPGTRFGSYNPVYVAVGVSNAGFEAGIGADDLIALGIASPDVATFSPRASVRASGPGCASVGVTVLARLLTPQRAFVQGPILHIPETRGSFRATIALGPAGPDAAASDVFTWVGPAQGAFANEGNWEDETGAAGAPGADTDTARFQGGTVRVDLAALAAASRAPRGVAAQCAGPVTRTIGRLLLDGGGVEPVNGALALDSLALDARSLTIEDNGLLDLREATVCARHAEIGATGRPSAALVSGPGGVLQTLGSLSLGSLGEGTLRVLNGGIVSSEEVLLGDGQEKGAAVVSDATWQTGNIAVGFQSGGELTIENAGLVESENAFVDRDLDPSGADTARATVRGANSTWRVDALVVGGRGTVEVEDGARLDAPASVGLTDGVTVGLESDPGEATLLVNDGGELRTRNLLVGQEGAGRLLVAEAFDRNPLVDAAFALFVGGPDGGRGRVQVIGDPSTDGFSLVSDEFQIGDEPGSNGELVIDFGGKALTSSDAFVGSEGGNGRVLVLGGSPLGAPPEQFTRWQISGSLTLGGPARPANGVLVIRDAAVDVGTLSTPGEVFIQPGGAILGTGSQSNLLRVSGGGLITNHGLIAGPLTVDARYDPASTGVVASSVAGLPPSPQLLPARSPAGAIAALGARRPKPALPPQGPVVFTGDTDLAGTLVLQFLNGFAPRQGQSFEVLDVGGTVTGAFASVEVRGLAPDSDFAEDFVDGALTLTALADAEPLPTVSVTTKPSVDESKFKKGLKVTFKRKGDTSEALQVAYTVGGTARNGFDYDLLSGVIEIPARKKSAKLVIRPVPDGVAEGAETIELEVQPGENYTQSLFAKAEIVLENEAPKKKP